MTEENTKNETSFLNEIAAEAAKIAASLSAISESNATEITDCACAAKKNDGTAAGLCLFENTIKELLEEIRSALFPDIFCCTSPEKSLVSAAKKLYCTLLSATGETLRAQNVTLEFLGALPEIRRVLLTDLSAGYRGDPAAKNEKEIALCYPCFYALTVHRLAHFLYAKNIPVLPRMMSEIAHSRTGIDIHPGAKIGEYFFIDHGTGVVIGETTVIGRNVKLYQGVTLGALSFPKDESTGMLMKGHKRHPNVEDNVVIYAGATILGGDTTIGHDSEIGGNVWLMDSIPPFSRVYNQTPFPRVKTREVVAE